MTLVLASPQSGRRGRRVLVTDGANGQGRSALAAVRALAAGGFEPEVTVSGPHSLAAASRWCRAAHRVPLVSEAPAAYADAVRTVLARPGMLCALPASDAAIVALGAPGHDLIDKRSLGSRAEAAGLRAPVSIVAGDAAQLTELAGTATYPLVVKPAVSRLPATRVATAAALREFGAAHPAAGPLVIQPYLDDPLRSVAGVMWDDRLHVAVHQRYERTWPIDCGPSSAATTTDPDLAAEAGLTRLLQGYRGLVHAQFAGPYLLDLNLRVYGSLPLGLAAGVNLPGTLCELAIGGAPPAGRARAGVPYRWIEGDARCLYRSWREGRMTGPAVLRALRPRRGSAHSVVSLRDLRPLMARLAFVARRREGN